ncbi:outer membrane protein OmpA-like peptidoglycan-associated protein [Serratia fonticola]|uniref:Outer membrane protein OmpA-like peptidoglycan-associated protein n=1 Tax=Serratia fonticola TaxID=47917 RepID=A0A559T9I5_SERFO|nr:OmpA family protein [Serratia fonticola]TQI81196.1 outer membrane protein OmpA-like peptidoglycan-associated protein [Serratia fonticola]TQI96780.1 outer membrane protein OmpA-like peptidoglycan-associated protein [Serratia fonticola]TVZ71276.1 outer membrane protein OmpA-like peptidoglycan-associated protein [Serratia fonticola]
MSVVLKRVLWCWGGLLGLVVLWGFLPLSPAGLWGMTLLVILLVAVTCGWLTRSAHALNAKIALATAPVLPPAGFDGVLVLVCGDSAPLLFDASERREVRQGWYLAVPTPERFLHTVQWIAAHHPIWLPQIVVMLCVVPERHSDEAQLRGDLYQWRVAINQCRSWLQGEPPVILCGYVNPVVNLSETQAPLWFADVGDVAGVSVWGADNSVQPYPRWAAALSGKTLSERFMQGIALDAWMSWLATVVMDEWQCSKTALPVLPVSLWAVNFTPVVDVENNLWQQVLREQTTLEAPLATVPGALPFPDLFLPLLPHRQGLTPIQRFACRGALLFAGALAIALLASFINNQRVIDSVGDDLARYRALSGTPPEPKLLAQQRLREDEQLLARYQRQGVPLSLGLGLYQGMTLYPVVQAALGDWVAPVPAVPVVPPTPTVVIQAAPQTVRLDSLSLFDTGKYQLKNDSTKVLVAALMNIKAKPGWLIVVAGHTDITGDAKANQILSLKRAEAVRDWMLQTSDVSPTCFAVQGFGATRPVASNDTEQGRAANRRVEISLVPQANACQGPDSITPPEQDSGFDNQGE